MAGTTPQTQAANAKALGRATGNLATVLGAIGVGGKDGLADVGVEAVNAIRVLLSTPGKGRTYRRPGVRGPRAVIHRASAPGQPPAVDTGQLRASYTWRLGRDSLGDFVEIGTNVKTAPWLEYGTRRMAARPHLRPTMVALRGVITALIREGIITKQREVIRRLPPEVSV